MNTELRNIAFSHESLFFAEDGVSFKIIDPGSGVAQLFAKSPRGGGVGMIFGKNLNGVHYHVRSGEVRLGQVRSG
jgi:hypothetical protein